MKMHYCTCRINLSGQGFTIHEILETEPMSWPELQIMMALHGDENIYDIRPISIADTDPVTEKRRLAAKYRQTAIVEQVFPGRSPQMEMLMPGEPADQRRADDDGRPQLPDDDDDNEVLGREPPTGPAVMKPSPIRRPFPAPSSEP